MASKDSAPDAARLPMPSRNPMPLSATQEAAIRDLYHERVKRHCSDEIKAFSDCAKGRTITISFACRVPLRLMNACMKEHASQAEHDAAREEWFALRQQRQKERERKEIKKTAQEDFIREWWGLPERTAEAKKKLADRLAMEERVGGLSRSKEEK
ncbi:uncharacterized protein DNG_04921 [Cephalotrichum gorgonifer]|uniref:COX assembly mitochondrial protein n=1 Tax=Cephalotrichum gorgonifer TaxID=2041049 RepID=A0AAE8SV11_9PEZI|nr:uncharacterized protein DNG_04921 [Cephalotrichum gorgonifer]